MKEHCSLNQRDVTDAFEQIAQILFTPEANVTVRTTFRGTDVSVAFLCDTYEKSHSIKNDPVLNFVSRKRTGKWKLGLSSGWLLYPVYQHLRKVRVASDRAEWTGGPRRSFFIKAKASWFALLMEINTDWLQAFGFPVENSSFSWLTRPPFVALEQSMTGMSRIVITSYTGSSVSVIFDNPCSLMRALQIGFIEENIKNLKFDDGTSDADARKLFEDLEHERSEWRGEQGLESDYDTTVEAVKASWEFECDKYGDNDGYTSEEVLKATIASRETELLKAIEEHEETIALLKLTTEAQTSSTQASTETPTPTPSTDTSTSVTTTPSATETPTPSTDTPQQTQTPVDSSTTQQSS